MIIIYLFQEVMGFHGGSENKESACNAGEYSSITGLGRSTVKEMATYSSILAWRILRTGEPGGLPIVHGVSKSWTQLSN